MASTATTTTEKEQVLLVLTQHPSHEHPLELFDMTDVPVTLTCPLCHRKISTTAEAYACHEHCQTYFYHKVCVEAPPQIDRHPLHPAHPLLLVHNQQQAFVCDSCGESFYPSCSSFRCHECDLDLDIACALSTLFDEGRYQCGKTSELITLPLHPHPLTSFSKRHDFVEHNDCDICKGSVEEDGYTCLRQPCEFVIHKACIRDLYYVDGTKAPRVYHVHRLETFVEEDKGSRACASCGSDKSGEFIGCASCQVFYHRDCFLVPEILQYPSHRSDHTLVLFLSTGTIRQCESCSSVFMNEIYYGCTSCEFSVHVGCALQVLAYCGEGMSAEIELSWHKHPLILRHLTESAPNGCDYCQYDSIGPTYFCKQSCGFLLHKRCTEIESTITHPHHLDHPLTLFEGDGDVNLHCKACGESTWGGTTWGLRFTCNSCLVYLHVKCVGRFPTHKHYLHEHELLRLDEYQRLECNRCGKSNNSPLFRCVSCNFNLHEECMKLPKVMRNDKIHWHPLTLHETFLEDDTGEYYCEHCEKTRDPRLGVYVCEHCKISLPRIYHIHCVLPELGKLYEKKRLSSAFQKLNEQITDKEETVRAIDKELKETTQKLTQRLEEETRELDELVKQRNKILDEDL